MVFMHSHSVLLFLLAVYVDVTWYLYLEPSVCVCKVVCVCAEHTMCFALLDMRVCVLLGLCVNILNVVHLLLMLSYHSLCLRCKSQPFSLLLFH